MGKWKKPVLVFMVLLLLGAGVIAFILPGIIKGRAIRGIEEATGRKAAIAAIHLNPFTWTARVEGFRLREKGADVTFAAFSSVQLSVSPRSLLRFAPIVSEIQVAAPYVRIVRTAANTYNFSDLLAGKKESEKPLRFSLNNITITHGSVDFLDRGLSREKDHAVRQIEVGIPFISNIPYLADRYVLPRFSAVINGAPLHMDGKLKPFATGAEMSFGLILKDVSLPYYLAYYPGTPPVTVSSGQLSTTLDIIHRIGKDNSPDLEVRGRILLEHLEARENSGAPLVALARGEVAIGRGRITARDYALTTITADGLDVHLTRDRKGRWNFQRLADGGKSGEKGGQQPDASAPRTLFAIDSIKLDNGRLHMADSLPPGGFSTDADNITLDVHGFSTAPGKKAAVSLSLATGRGEKLNVKGEFSPTPVAFTASTNLEQVRLDAYYPYLADFLNAPVRGTLDFSSQVAYADNMFTADRMTARLRNVAADFGAGDGIRFADTVMEDGRYHQKENVLEIPSVAIAGGDIRFSRDREGNFSPVRLLKTSKPRDTETEKRPAAAGPPFLFRMKKFAVKGLAVSFTDRKVADEPTFDVRRMNLDIGNLAWPERETTPFSFSAGYGSGGRIRASGKLRPSPFALRGEVTLAKIPLTDFDAYLPDNLHMTLADGSLDTTMSFNLAEANGKMTGSFSGDLGVRSFHSLGADDEDLLSWESLELDNLRGTLAPFTLNVAGVALNRFYSRIVVEKDGTLNLTKLYVSEQKGQPQPPPTAPQPQVPPHSPPATPPGSSAAKPEEPGNVQIGTVTLQEGTISFADRHTKPEYASTMTNLGGRISGLSSAANQLADVDLRGNLENHSPLRITGKINPLRDDLFVDLKVSFTDIELSPFTPYSGTYLGYAVDKGKLYLNLRYRIEHKKLDSENKVFIDQFTFGNKVESDKATSLPVRLAIALLKDRKGEIHLDLPVSGRTDDPKFSVWRVVLQILKNLLVKAATSPLSLLQSAFGGKADFSTVLFEPGSARLTDSEREKLTKLAEAVHDRPAVKVEVSGFVDKQRDPEGYREELLRKKMKNEKFLALVKEKKNLPGQTAESLEILPQESSTYLTAVYRKEKFPKPRNFIGIAKDLPDTEMRKLILAHTVVSDDDLRNLARERAVAVRSFLVGDGKLPPERIFEKKGDIFAAPAREGESASRVELGASGQ